MSEFLLKNPGSLARVLRIMKQDRRKLKGVKRRKGMAEENIEWISQTLESLSVCYENKLFKSQLKRFIKPDS